MSASPLRLLARISAGLLVLHVFFFWAAERQGKFFGFSPEHFKDSAILFFFIAVYLLLESHFLIKEREVIEEEIVSITEQDEGGIKAVSPQTVWKNPYIAAAIIVGVALIIAGVLMSGPQKTGTPAVSPAAPTAAPAPQQPAAAPAPGQKVDVSFGTTPILNKSAKVALIEFTDFQCPYCGKFFTDAFGQIKKNYIDTGKIAFEARDYPLPFHPFAQKAAEAARCALAQGEKSYWTMHDWMYANQTTLDIPSLKAQAKKIGLNSSKFDQCLDGSETAAAVKTDYDAGSAYGVSGTPSFFLNGELIVGAQPYATFAQKIDAALAAK